MLDYKMAVQNVALLVFLFPVVITIGFGTFVLADVLSQPDRELNMWPFANLIKTPTQTGDQGIEIQGLQKEYSINVPVEIKVLITDQNLDCGDLYITIYDEKVSPKQIVKQHGYFSQCFVKENLPLPIGDQFSTKIDKTGNYEIVAEMNDKNYQKTITKAAKFKIL